MMPLDTPMKQVKIIRNILKDSYFETFNNHITEVEDGKEKRALKEEDVDEALEKVTLKAFRNDHHAYRRQVRYMRYQLYFTTTNFENFFHRLKQLNNYLKYFPIPPQKGEVKPLSEDDLMEIIDNAKPLEYNQAMLQNNYYPYDKPLMNSLGMSKNWSKLPNSQSCKCPQLLVPTQVLARRKGKRGPRTMKPQAYTSASIARKWLLTMMTTAGKNQAMKNSRNLVGPSVFVSLRNPLSLAPALTKRRNLLSHSLLISSIS